MLALKYDVKFNLFSVPVAVPVFGAARELILNPSARSAQLHCDLAELNLNDTEDVEVVSHHSSSESVMVTLPRLSEQRASLGNELKTAAGEVTEVTAVCSGSLVLYTEEGVTSRCLVQGRDGDVVEIYLLDSGETRLCSRDGFDLKENELQRAKLYGLKKNMTYTRSLSSLSDHAYPFRKTVLLFFNLWFVHLHI